MRKRELPCRDPAAQVRRYDSLTQSSAFTAEGSLFAHLGKHEIFTPAKTYPSMTVGELASLAPEVIV